MARLKVYLDTSVFSAYFDERAKMRLEQTREFWTNLSAYDRFASELVLEELSAVSDDTLRENLVSLANDFHILHVDEEANTLAQVISG